MKKKGLLFLALPMLALALVAGIMVYAVQGAHAASPKTHMLGVKNHPSRYSGGGNNLNYNGGPVMTGTTRAYAIFWEPSGSYVSPTYNSLIDRYFGDVGTSALYRNNTQYTDTSGKAPSGAVFGGSWVDTSAYPSSTLLDNDIHNEVTKAQQQKGWKSSIHNIFFVFTAKNENICYDSQNCSFTVFCAYHGFFGTNTIYAAMPYTGTNLAACGVNNSPNNDFDADSTINVTSHEQMEAATDPLLNAWYDAGGAEIGDKCAWTFGPLNSQGGDVSWHKHPYIVQEEWDNKVGGCVVKGP